MTLLERFRFIDPRQGEFSFTLKDILEIRRALAIAQAVEEDGAISEFLSYGRIMRRADELEGKK